MCAFVSLWVVVCFFAGGEICRDKMTKNDELEMMTNLSKSLLTPVGFQDNPILTRAPGNNSHVDTTNSTSMHTNPPVIETKLSQNWIWSSLEGFELSGITLVWTLSS